MSAARRHPACSPLRVSPGPGRFRCLLAPALPLLLAACGGSGGSDGAPGGWVSVSDTLGDTVVVRTLSGSLRGSGVLLEELSIGTLEGPPETQFGNVNGLAVSSDGTIHVMDAQGPVLRSYSPDGRFLRTVGRVGSGPGEYRQPDSGLAVLPDGRLLVRDPGNARIAVYGSDGEPLDSWIVRGGFTTSRPLYVDREGRAWYMLLLDPAADLADWRMGLLRLSPAGEPIDTVPAPVSEHRDAFLEARREGGVSRTSVPFTPRFSWTVNADGGWVTALSTDYRLEVHRPEGGVLRLEREWTPVPVDPAEKRAHEERVTRNMRSGLPTWRWNGPPIPDAKPPFQSIHPARDGRIWVLLHDVGRMVEEARPDPRGDGVIPEVWRDRVRFDVFEADGRFLGTVRAPDGLTVFPEPVIRGDTVWALTRDELDVQRVVRYRVDWDGGAPG